MIGIYKITSPTGKVYIGQSWNITHRLERYRTLDCVNQTKLYASLSKHSWDKHVFEIIHKLPFDVTQDIMNNYEILYWQQYKDCGCDMMNVKEPGSNGKHSEETKKKISIANTGRKMTEEQRLLMIEISKNRPPVSEETKKKISEAVSGSKNHFYGKTHSSNAIKKMSDKKLGIKRGPYSKEHKKKISESHKGEKNQWYGVKGKAHPLYGRTRPDLSESKKGEKNPMFGKTGDKSSRSKKVSQIDKDRNKIIATFGSTMEAERQTGVNNKSIQHCCKGKSRSAGGFIWKYI